MMDRLKFIQIIIGYSLSLACGIAQTSVPSFSYPFQTLPDAFRAIGYNPAIKENSFFVVTADVHYGSEGNGMLATINEVNKLYPYPAFFCVDGDMIVNGSSSFGVIPTPYERQAAINEFKAFKKDAELLDQKIRLILVLGNHDTHPKEIDPELFWEVFPGYPPYQSFNLSGVHIIVLNGHSTGYIDTRQMEWLINDVNEIRKNQAIIILIHQPAMSSRVAERGIPETILKVFKDHIALIWLIGGHAHTNTQRVYQLQKTKVIQHGITCGTENIWGGPERPGYWIYCLRNGEVTGRIYRKLETGYRLEAKPDLSDAEKVPVPFDHIDNIVWKVFAGSKDEQKYLVHTDGRDCINWWSYVSELTYCLPLKETGNKCTKIAMLCEYKAMKDQIYQEGQYFLSVDQMNWKEIKLEHAAFDTMNFIIPGELCQAENIYFKFIAPGDHYSTYIHFGGFALLR